MFNLQKFTEQCRQSSYQAFENFKIVLRLLEDKNSRRDARLFLTELVNFIQERFGVDNEAAIESYHFTFLSINISNNTDHSEFINLFHFPSTFTPEEWSYTFFEGLSRYGKAAVVAMAFEPRFSLGFIGSSGAGGTKILRRVFGEQVENLASSAEYHWFCGNFIKYAGTLKPDDMPVDAHELVALCAPRPVFISAGSPQVEGQWVDAKGTFLGGVHAGSVYRLLGKKDLGTIEFPKLGTPLIDGEIAFRQHAGGHSTGPNWSTWIAWACRYWGECKYF